MVDMCENDRVVGGQMTKTFDRVWHEWVSYRIEVTARELRCRGEGGVYQRHRMGSDDALGVWPSVPTIDVWQVQKPWPPIESDGEGHRRCVFISVRNRKGCHRERADRGDGALCGAGDQMSVGQEGCPGLVAAEEVDDRPGSDECEIVSGCRLHSEVKKSRVVADVAMRYEHSIDRRFGIEMFCQALELKSNIGRRVEYEYVAGIGEYSDRRGGAVETDGSSVPHLG